MDQPVNSTNSTVRVGSLSVGSQFTTGITHRMGIVLDAYDHGDVGIRVLFASGVKREKVLHPDVQVRV